MPSRSWLCRQCPSVLVAAFMATGCGPPGWTGPAPPRMQPKFTVEPIEGRLYDRLVYEGSKRPNDRATLAEQREFLAFVIRNAKALGCFPLPPFREPGARAYVGQTVFFFAPSGSPLPALAGTTFKHASDSDEAAIERSALKDCRASPELFVNVAPGSMRLERGERAVAAYCISSLTRYGASEHDYPAGSVGFLGHKLGPDKWRVLRGPVSRATSPPFEQLRRAQLSECESLRNRPGTSTR